MVNRTDAWARATRRAGIVTFAPKYRPTHASSRARTRVVEVTAAPGDHRKAFTHPHRPLIMEKSPFHGAERGTSP